MNEHQFEDIIERYPELIEPGLTFQARQFPVKGRFIDLLFIDRHGQKLIVELKNGTILRKHVGQLMDYEGELLNPDDPTVRVMLIGNRVPPNLRRSLEHHGFEWKELTHSGIIGFLRQRNDTEFLRYFSEEETTEIGYAAPMQENKALTMDGPANTIPHKILFAIKARFGEILSGRQIIDLVEAAFPGTNRTSVIPSDYCYNILNRGIKFDRHFFEYRDGQYKILGPNYEYVGPIYWKGKKVGEWRKGEKTPRIWERVSK
ncbi:MAG: endonuclease NucS domain-containing protein [Syntrophobacteraceae bacterium]